jgi:hypothetical protein
VKDTLGEEEAAEVKRFDAFGEVGFTFSNEAWLKQYENLGGSSKRKYTSNWLVFC